MDHGAAEERHSDPREVLEILCQVAAPSKPPEVLCGGEPPKLFYPLGIATWLLTELDFESLDIAFGLCVRDTRSIRFKMTLLRPS